MGVIDSLVISDFRQYNSKDINLGWLTIDLGLLTEDSKGPPDQTESMLKTTFSAPAEPNGIAGFC